MGYAERVIMALPTVKVVTWLKSLPGPVAKLVLGSAFTLVASLALTGWVALTFKPPEKNKIPAASEGELRAGEGENLPNDSVGVKESDSHATEAEQGEASHGDAGHGEAAHGEAGHGDPIHGEGQAETNTHGDPNPGSEDSNLLRQLAQEYAQNGQIEKALPLVEKALAQKHNPAEFMALAARVLMAGGRYTQAREAAESALELLRERPDLEVLIMMARYREGQIDAAMSQAMELLQKQPHDVDLLTALGTMHAEQHTEDATADGYLAQALKLNPNHVPALYQMGRRQMHSQHYQQAEKNFCHILTLRPDYAKAQAQLGMAYYYQERLEQARQTLITALQGAPRDYNTWYNLGEVYLQQAGEIAAKKPEAAEALRQRSFSCYNRAIELNPDHAHAHYRLGLLLIGNNQPKEAVRHLEFAVEREEGLVAAWLQLALAYESLQQFERAHICLDKAYALDPLNKAIAMKLREWG
jgi:tetratricopeptide (TPR) repeat protein